MYRDVLVRRYANTLGRTMWDHATLRDDQPRWLVLGFTDEAATASADSAPALDGLIAYGRMLSDDGTRHLSAAAILEAANEAAALQVLPEARYTDIEAHLWRPGGRPS